MKIGRNINFSTEVAKKVGKIEKFRLELENNCKQIVLTPSHVRTGKNRRGHASKYQLKTILTVCFCVL